MKKILCVVLALAMVFGLTACTTKTESKYSNGLTKDGFYDLKALDIVTLPELEGVVIPEEYRAASAEAVQSQIDQILDTVKETSEDYDKVIEAGDKVNIDYSGSIDGEVFEGGTAAGQVVTAGTNEFIDDFLYQIIGHKPGENFDVEVTFPETYPQNPDLAGKDAVFAIVINHVETYTYPDFDDAFVEEHYGETLGIKTAAGLKAYIEKNIIAGQLNDYIDDYLYNNSEVSEIPEAVIEHQKNLITANYEDTAAQYGVDVQTLLTMTGETRTLDEIIEESSAQFESMGKDVLLYQAAAEKLDLTVSNNDIADYFENVSGSRDYQTYSDHYGMPYLRMIVMTTKVADYIIEKSN